MERSLSHPVNFLLYGLSLGFNRVAGAIEIRICNTLASGALRGVLKENKFIGFPCKTVKCKGGGLLKTSLQEGE